MRNQMLLLGAVLLIGAIDVASSYRVWKLAQANGKFGLCLYSKVIDDNNNKNVFLSPFSISTALSMTYAGARGKTASEMCHVLGFSPLNFNVHDMFRATLESMNAGQSPYCLALANGVFVDVDFPMRQSYRSLLANYYSAGFKELDFQNNAKGTADHINKWVEERTNNKIQNIVDEVDIVNAKMALVNAIYFKGRWTCPFDPKKTREATFHISPSEKTQVNMMIQTACFKCSLNRRLGCQILELPYKGHQLSMYILLPTRKNGLASLERKLTSRKLSAALHHLCTRRMSVAIPRFKMTAELNLPKTLQEMGMKLAFNTQADFRRMSLRRPLSINKVIHKAFIGVDEDGTEATAATVVTMGYGAVPLEADFAADHPFFFLIRDNKTGSILFLGRLMKPPQQ